MIVLLGKGGPILWVIIALSFVAMAIVIERLLYFRKTVVDEDRLMARLRSSLDKRHYDEALSICDSHPAPITNLMKVGIEHRRYSPQV